MEERKMHFDHTPVTPDDTVGQQYSNSKFLGVHIREYLCWTSCVTALAKKAKQCFHCLHLLKEMHLLSLVPTPFYRDTTERVLTTCITVTSGN